MGVSIPGNQELYTYLQYCGYILIFKPVLVIKKDGRSVVKGNVDAELVLHAMIEYANYEKAVIVAADGDYHCLVGYLEKNHKLEKIIVPNQFYSKLLREFTPFISSLTPSKEKFRKQQRRKAFPHDARIHFGNPPFVMSNSITPTLTCHLLNYTC